MRGWLICLPFVVLGTGCLGHIGMSAEDACAKGSARACDDLAEAAMKESAKPGIYLHYCERGGARSCLFAAGEIERSEGATPETAERLVALPQLACQRGVMGGCNLLGHYTKFYVRRCEYALKAVPLCGGAMPKEPLPEGYQAGVARVCGIAGVVMRMGTRIPAFNGRSYPPDLDRAKAMFTCACAAGSAFACAQKPGS
jgi:hypothetical protein